MKKKSISSKKPKIFERYPEMKGLLLLMGTLICLLSFLSFDPGSSQTNWLGISGYLIGYSLSFCFGVGTLALLYYTGALGIAHLGRKKVRGEGRGLYFSIFLFSICTLLNVLAQIRAPFPDILAKCALTQTLALDHPYPHIYTRHNLGGIPLYYLYYDLPTFNLHNLLSNTGVGLTLSFSALVSLLLATQTKLSSVAFCIMATLKWTGRKMRLLYVFFRSLNQKKREKEPMEEVMEELLYTPQSPLPKKIPTKRKSKPLTLTTSAPSPTLSQRESALRQQRVANGDFTHFQIPPTDMLHNPPPIDQSMLKQKMHLYAQRLEKTLLNFGIEAKVGDIHIGPTITLFEVHPSVGVKVQKIKALSNDIALNMEAKSIRIIAPIPGKAAVGVEIPSLVPQAVSFRQLLSAYHKEKKKFQIPILLGKTVTGEYVMSDLAKMPHCIIAGATGSGKSVCINTIVMSIVMNARPDEIRLLMVDPKKVELSGYTNLPHMIAPVITEAHGAYAALNWLVKEMQKRYETLRQLSLRNITAFNQRKRNKSFEESLDIEIPETMPKFVAIIDEFADLMMAASSDLETPIARIAQMARAVGIHLILATQRPSREVITGLIKANFPTRISFKVASRINSQIILDEVGAESLLGNGDMLFLPPGSSHLIRAQGTYISDEEISQIVKFICNQAPCKYLIPSFDTMQKEELQTLTGIEDESKHRLYDDALKMVLETGSASATFLQRKLKVGYPTAASLMDELEASGVIGPQEGARPRKILMKAPQLDG